MKKCIVCFFFIFTNSLQANTFEGCGEYKFHGVLKLRPLIANQLEYVVNEGNQSQMIFEFEKKDYAQKLIPYLNKTSSFQGEILKNMDGTKGIISSVSEISERIPNPMKTENTGISLMTKKKCR